jgi:hypothetical protein
VADEPKKPEPDHSTENPRSFEWPWSRKGQSDAARVSGECVIPSRASKISHAPPPPPSMSESSGYAMDAPKEPEQERSATVREAVQRASRTSDERDAARDYPGPHSGHHSATSDATTTGRTLDYIGLAFILVPPEPVVAALVKGEPIHWEIALPLLFGCWVVGGAILHAGLTWPKWKPRNEMVASTISRGVSNIWVWLAILIVIAFGPTMLYSALSPRTPTVQLSTTPGTLCSDGPCAPLHVKPGPKYLKSIGLGRGGAEPLSLFATPAFTSDRLRIFVDYSEYRSGWMDRTRAFIGEIKEPVKDKTERLQLIFSGIMPNGGTNNLWWGDPLQNHPLSSSTFNGDPLPAILVRGRVVIVGANGEQHYYFVLVRATGNVGTQVGVIPEHDSGDWIEDWEKE